ncbi:MAG: hypothetical protein HY094_09245 [Candidatus Melainabacteria bacterium]|nr:hypothetical protein [Candidatus Melainabacteria bacterium]
MRLRLNPEQLLPPKQPVKQFNATVFDNDDMEKFLKELEQKSEPTDLSNTQNKIKTTSSPKEGSSWTGMFKDFFSKLIPKFKVLNR